MKKHDNYWRAIYANVLQTALIVVFVVGVFWVTWQITDLVLPSGSKLPAFRFDISAPSALAASGVLATLIVALQVGVRTPFSKEDLPAAAARQIGLESLASLAGAAAFTVGLAATIGQEGTWNLGDPLRYAAPLVGALLLAIFAADAASASSARLGEAIALERKKASSDRLKRAIQKLSEGASPATLKRHAIRVVASVAITPAVVVASFFSYAYGAHSVSLFTESTLYLGILYFGISILLASTFLVASRYFWTTRRRLAAVYVALLSTSLLAAVTLVANILQPGVPNDVRELAVRFLVTALITVPWSLACLSLGGQLPSKGGRSLGTEAVLLALKCELKLAMPDRDAATTVRNIGIVVSSLAVPPVGLIWAYIARRAGHGGRAATAGLWIGSIMLLFWATGLLIVNPPLP